MCANDLTVQDEGFVCKFSNTNSRQTKLAVFIYHFCATYVVDTLIILFTDMNVAGEHFYSENVQRGVCSPMSL